MKDAKLLLNLLSETKAYEIILSFILFFTIIASIITFIEPDFMSYGDGLWYCFSVVTTIGFGDLIVSTILGRVLTVLLSLHGILVIAIITSLIVHYYSELEKLRVTDFNEELLEKLSRLSTLEKKELDDISTKIMKYRKKNISKKNNL